MAEVQNLIVNDVLQGIPISESQRLRGNVVPVIVITVQKFGPDGNFIKWKSRICARGDKQRLQSDTPTYAPVISFPILLIQLNSLVSNLAMADPALKIGADFIDIGSAYLEADLDSTIHAQLSDDISNMLIQLRPTLPNTNQPMAL